MRLLPNYLSSALLLAAASAFLGCAAGDPAGPTTGTANGSSTDNSSGNGSSSENGAGNGSSSQNGAGNGSSSQNGAGDGSSSSNAGNGSSSSAGNGSSSSAGNGSSSNSGSGSTMSIDEDQDLILDPDVVNLAPPAGCGDGNLTSDEACDDGNLESGDGCAANCLQLEPGYSCAAPGEACRAIARCGDGLVAPSEQCDDGNELDADGCSARCRVELGSKCDGQPSTCTPAECGNGMVEGAEACDDGNNEPFDGCSSICLREPNCEGLSCTSECGDGLVINEDCDDGNTVSGDGCSADCKKEAGFTCSQEATCEKINDECVLRVPTIFRDFPGSHPDFGDHNCSDLLTGIVQPDLDIDGRPTTTGNGLGSACIDSNASFEEWYRDGGDAVTVIGEIMLFDNGKGGYVNRFGSQGEKFTSIDDTTERSGGSSLAECTNQCNQEARNNHGSGCDNYCRPDTSAVEQARNELQQAEQRVTQAIQQYGAPEADGAAPIQVTNAQADVAEIEAEIVVLTATANTCMTECEAAVAEETEICASTCKECSYDPDQFCRGGELVEWDGNPLFFPVDSVTGRTSDLGDAKIPEQYGYNGWPWEYEWFPGAPEHNFYFTSEVQYWFRYEADTNATLDFTGDDDVWVFVNGKLAVDLGGIHVPENGSVTINQASAARFNLSPGNVYKITIFHAERQMEGSSFKLTLAGFEATPSDCTAICGDNVLSFGEECDDGVNDGGYGECDVGCKLGPYCGDGEVQGDEDCDNGPGGGEGCPNCRILTIL